MISYPVAVNEPFKVQSKMTGENTANRNDDQVHSHGSHFNDRTYKKQKRSDKIGNEKREQEKRQGQREQVEITRDKRRNHWGISL